jgi:hypothetical protein
MATPTSALLPLRALVKECQKYDDTRGLTYPIIWRGMRDGSKVPPGVKIHIAHRRRGGKLISSIDAIRDWLAAIDEADKKHFDIKGTNPKHVARRIESAHRESVALLGPVRHR